MTVQEDAMVPALGLGGEGEMSSVIMTKANRGFLGKGDIWILKSNVS